MRRKIRVRAGSGPKKVPRWKPVPPNIPDPPIYELRVRLTDVAARYLRELILEDSSGKVYPFKPVPGKDNLVEFLAITWELNKLIDSVRVFNELSGWHIDLEEHIQ